MSLIKQSFNLALLCATTFMTVNTYADRGDWDMNDPQSCRGGVANPYNPPLPTQCECVGDRVHCVFQPAS